MELREIARALRRRQIAVVAVVLVAIAAEFGVQRTAHSATTGAATAQILIDSPKSALTDLSQDTGPLTTRATIFAQFMSSTVILQQIADVTGVPLAQITAQGPYSGPGQVLNVVTPSPARGQQLHGAIDQYRLTFVAQTTLPIVTVSAQAPDAAKAAKLADGAFLAVQRYLGNLDGQSQTPPRARVTVRELGRAQAGSVTSSSMRILMIAAGIGTIVIGMLFVLAYDRLRRGRPVDQDEDGAERRAPVDIPPAFDLAARKGAGRAIGSAPGIGAHPSSRSPPGTRASQQRPPSNWLNSDPERPRSPGDSEPPEISELAT